ncbi:hypothetical protein F5B21DRAFT_508458 [Xylaria acuta]|nr:hypothetical protein F5B21DRAFT_508458 [Xylaria acuta]
MAGSSSSGYESRTVETVLLPPPPSHATTATSSPFTPRNNIDRGIWLEYCCKNKLLPGGEYTSFPPSENPALERRREELLFVALGNSGPSRAITPRDNAAFLIIVVVFIVTVIVIVLTLRESSSPTTEMAAAAGGAQAAEAWNSKPRLARPR